MLVTGRFGLRSYDITRAERPRFLDAVDNEELRLQGDPPVDTDDSDDVLSTYWQNEDMDVDRDRKLVFMARDPRSFKGTTRQRHEHRRRLHRRRARNPRRLGLITFHQLPTGHTTTCVNGCDYLWTGGPASSVSQRAGMAGRAADHRHGRARPGAPGRMRAGRSTCSATTA